MRSWSLKCSMLLIAMCLIMQQQSAAAKPFIFKFFAPQEPARTEGSSSSSSTSFSTGIDFGSILSTKLNLLTSLLRTKFSNGVSGGFNFGLTKLLPAKEVASTRRPYTSTTISAPDDEFEPESSTKTSLKTTASTTASTTTTATTITERTIKSDQISGSDILSEPIANNGKDTVSTVKVTAEKKQYVNVNESQETTEKTGTVASVRTTKDESGYDYSTSKANSGVSTFRPNGNGYSVQQTGYNYDYSNQGMSENEISNEIMAISNQYLPAF